MNTDLISLINKSPLKKKFIAKEIGIHPGVLSMCIKGDRFLNPEKEEKLREILKKVS